MGYRKLPYPPPTTEPPDPPPPPPVARIHLASLAIRGSLTCNGLLHDLDGTLAKATAQTKGSARSQTMRAEVIGVLMDVASGAEGSDVRRRAGRALLRLGESS